MLSYEHSPGISPVFLICGNMSLHLSAYAAEAVLSATVKGIIEVNFSFTITSHKLFKMKAEDK